MSDSIDLKKPNEKSFKSSTESLLSPKKAAKVLGVSESSVKRWCDAGHLAVVKTSGGHRRISVQTLMSFARSKGHNLENPQLIDFPAMSQAAPEADFGELYMKLEDGLANGYEDVVRSILISKWMSGEPLANIFDNLLAPAFSNIGHKWESNQIEIYEERRAVLMVERSFADMRRLVGPSKPSAPVAVGCTLEGDPYALPTAMCELTLRELGWNAQNLGSWQPLKSMAQAIKNIQPRLFWLSVSKVAEPETFPETICKLYQVAEENNCALIIGGRGVTDAELRKQLEFSGYCDSMSHFMKLAKQIHSA